MGDETDYQFIFSEQELKKIRGSTIGYKQALLRNVNAAKARTRYHQTTHESKNMRRVTRNFINLDIIAIF